MTIPGRLLLVMMVISILSYGFSASAFAQFAGCGPNEVRDITGECVSAFGGESTAGAPFSIDTDKSSYNDGETIRITGSILTLNENYPVPVTILLVDSTNGNIVSVAQVMPNSAGDYSYSITAGGTMKTSGC